VFSISAVLYVNPIYNTNRFVLQEVGILLGVVTDCEELGGGLLT